LFVLAEIQLNIRNKSVKSVKSEHLSPWNGMECIMAIPLNKRIQVLAKEKSSQKKNLRFPRKKSGQLDFEARVEMSSKLVYSMIPR